MAQKWATIQSIWKWWLKVSHQKWATIWQFNSDILFEQSSWFQSNNFSYNFWRDFQLNWMIFRFFIFGRSFWAALHFRLSNSDIWIPRIEYDVWWKFRAKWVATFEVIRFLELLFSVSFERSFLSSPSFLGF